MRFFEYEAREIVKRAGIPVTELQLHDGRVGGARDRGAHRRPTVITSQVLTGGRTKAGGGKFADMPEQAEAFAADILKLEINGQHPRGVRVEPKTDVKQEYYAGVVWDGVAKKPSVACTSPTSSRCRTSTRRSASHRPASPAFRARRRGRRQLEPPLRRRQRSRTAAAST
jgi:succinyl-CoA synthetase beta subunit